MGVVTSPVDAERPARILIADDDRAIRESLDRLLSMEGHQVLAVADGAAALSAVQSGGLDAILLDLMMPNIDGLTVCRLLRSEGNRVPILIADMAAPHDVRCCARSSQIIASWQ